MKKYLFIVAFLVGAQKLGAQLVIGDSPKQPKAPGKSLLELNNKENDNAAIPGGLLLPKRKKDAGGSSSTSTESSDVSGFSEGALVYNDGGYFEILTVKNSSGTAEETNKELEWKRLASGADAKRPELINVTGQVTNTTFPAVGTSGMSSSSSVTVTLPTGYVPYTKDGSVTESSSSSGSAETKMKQVVVKISYNGFGLKQKFSTTGGSTGTGTTSDADFEAIVESDNKVKITFLTLQPEEAADFDRILIQAVRN